jgi:hypothetical protein
MHDRQEDVGSRRRWSARRGAGRTALLAGLLALAGCAGGDSRSQQDLSLACEMRKCDCASDTNSFEAGIPVQWQLDGAAFCKKGYHLRILDLPPSSKMVT